MDVWECPVVMSCRGREIHVYPHTPGHGRWVRHLPAAFHRAAAVHCVSEAIRADATRFGLDPAKAWVIPPAVDTEFFRPPAARSNGGPLRLVSVGDLLWVKGHEYALQALRLLLDRGVPAHLDLIGEVRPDLVAEITDRERIVGTVEDLDLARHVRLAGRLEPREVRDGLQSADVLVHASLAEGLPNTVLEAMSCGLPVVVTDCGGTREAVCDGREGIVVAPRDAPAMATALEGLWRDPGLRARMGAAARARVEADFDLAEQVERLLGLYAHVTNGHREAGR
jgi:glycosyltransferase involved in cell wall biosynthesis